jgi:hypothetical protein
MSKEDRLEAGRARLRIAKEVSDVLLTVAFKPNFKYVDIISAHWALRRLRTCHPSASRMLRSVS